jgi:hypothetical protein
MEFDSFRVFIYLIDNTTTNKQYLYSLIKKATKT